MKVTINLGFAAFVLLFFPAMADSDPTKEDYLSCLSKHSSSPNQISNVTYFATDPDFLSVLSSYIRNAIFLSASTPKPLFIVAATEVSHIQAAVACCKTFAVQMRIRSGGHDYDGLSYVSSQPFMILDMFNMRSVTVNLEEETAWVESGATLGEVYHEIARVSTVLGFPAGVCPTVGAGGHFSGAGYGNLMRKFGLSVDNILDAIVVDVNGNKMDRAAMGEDFFWAINGGGGASFGVIVSWKIKLVRLPEQVTVFRIEKTLEENATDIVFEWQNAAYKIDNELFIRVVLSPMVKKTTQTVRAKFNALFLGDAEKLVSIMAEKFPLLGVTENDCHEMSWIKSVLFWSNYPDGTPVDILLDRHPEEEKRQKKKSDYVQEAIPKSVLEEMWKKMMEMKGPTLTFNPYGGKMDDFAEDTTPFPHRKGNMFKIQYSVMWKEEGDEVLNASFRAIREMHEFMTPYVSKSPRRAYLNYRDVDLGVNGDASSSVEDARKWAQCYFDGNFDRLVKVKTTVDPGDFFRYEQSIPSMACTTGRLDNHVHSGSSSIKFISW